ncbi:MAG: HEAT repeat domain-containing protein [Bacteroidales bacterium]|nr:HEAT repeat domain-containing protein [Bacteroidales bacterium]
MKKKTFFLAAAIAMTTMVCGVTQTAQAQDADKTADSLISSIIKTPKGQQIKLEEYKKLFLNFADAEIEKTTSDISWHHPVTKAIEKIGKDYKTQHHQIPGVKDFYFSLLTNESPQLRGKAMQYLEFWRTENEVVDKITDALQNETEPFVIIRGISAVGHKFSENEKLAKFMLAQVDNPNKSVRSQLAWSVVSLRNKDSEAAKDVARKLINDPEWTVQKNVLNSLGDFHDESFIDDLEKILNDPAQENLHSGAYKSLFEMWYNYNYTCKRAHDICYNYMSKKPRSKNVPNWLAVSMSFDNPAKYTQWRKEWKDKSPFFKESEWVNLLIDIAADSQAYSFARNSAIDTLKKLGTKEDLEAAKTKVAALPDTDRDRDDVIKRIDRVLNQ